MTGAQGVERVINGLTLTGGTINIGATSVLVSQGSQTFGGSGRIVFGNSSNNNRFFIEAGDLTLASGITVRGHTGLIGQQFLGNGAAGLIDFQGNGTAITTLDANLNLFGVNSQMQGRDAQGNVRTIDQTLSTNLRGLGLNTGRVFTASANGGNFINSGAITLGDVPLGELTVEAFGGVLHGEGHGESSVAVVVAHGVTLRGRRCGSQRPDPGAAPGRAGGVEGAIEATP